MDASACHLSRLLNKQFGSERVQQQQQQRPCLANISDGKQRTPYIELLPGSGTLSVGDEDAEDADEDCVAKVKNLRSIVDVELGDDISPDDALNASKNALPGPGGNDRGSLLTDEVHVTNQDEGFSSSAEDELDSLAAEVKETREDRISHQKQRKQTVLRSGNCNVSIENELPGINFSGEKLVSGSHVTSNVLGSSEEAFTSQDCVEKDAMGSARASNSQVAGDSEKLDENPIQDLDSKVLPTEIEKKGLAVGDVLFASASPKASHHHVLESSEETNTDNNLKHMDSEAKLTTQEPSGLLGSTEVTEEEDENEKESTTAQSSEDIRQRTVCADAAVVESEADKALRFSELSILRTCLGEDRTEVGSTPSCSDFDCAANYESEDEKKMDRSFDSPAEFKDSSAYKAERCEEAPDYAELFGFQMGDLQDRMDRQTGSFGQTTNRSVNVSPTESVDGTVSPGNGLPTASASFRSTLSPLQSSSCDQTGGDIVSPATAANAVPLTGSAGEPQSGCPYPIPAISSPLSDSYILTPSPSNSVPPSVSLASPISPAGGITGRPHVASTTHAEGSSSRVPDDGHSWSDAPFRGSSSRPLPYPDASSICKLQQLTSRLDEPSGNSDDGATMIGMQSQQQQQVAFLQPSSPLLPSSLLSPDVRKSSLEPGPLNRLQHLAPASNHSDSAFIPLQCGSPFQPPNQQSHFADSHPSLLLQNSAQLQNFHSVSANDRYPRNEDITCNTDLTPLSIHHRNSYHSAFHSHIPNLNFVQPPRFTSTSNLRYVANPASRRYCQSSILTPPPSVERNHAQSRNSQSLAYPLSYWIGPHDQNHIGMRNEDFGFRTSKRSLASDCSPAGGLESSVNSEDGGFYNILYLNSVGAHSLSSAH